MNRTYNSGTWIVDFELDELNSAASDLRIVDSTTLDHPQGALTLATINVAAFAPHLEEPISYAFLMAAAPLLYRALGEAIDLLQDGDAEASDADRVTAILIAARNAAHGGLANV